MKNLIVTILCAVMVVALYAQQVRVFDVQALYRGTTWNDSIKISGYDNGTPKIQLKSTSAADNLVSGSIQPNSGNTHFFIRTENISGTQNVQFDVGLWRGYTYDSTGIAWQKLGTATSDTLLEISIVDSTWNSKKPMEFIWLRAVETGNQQNYYQFDIHNYNPER